MNDNLYQCHPFHAVRAASYNQAALMFADRLARKRHGPKASVFAAVSEYQDPSGAYARYRISIGRKRPLPLPYEEREVLTIYRYVKGRFDK
tara:strand:- start:739 stop:1011 length:273 start_codon:yes stop_codon:yes gene_type:complete